LIRLHKIWLWLFKVKVLGDLRISQRIHCLLLLLFQVLLVLQKLLVVDFVVLFIVPYIHNVSFVHVLLHPLVRELVILAFLLN